MVHPQPSTNTHSDNPTELGISNNTNKGQLLRVIKMKYFWILKKVQTSNFEVIWSQVQENLSDYASKQHTDSHPKKVGHYYEHTRKKIDIWYKH